MKIVVLDGFSLNPGDLDWGRFLEITDKVVIYDRTPREKVLERANGAEILMTNKTVLDREMLSNLPQLQYIGVLATGYNVVDTDFAAKKGITVTNIPTYGTESVAQTVFALLLEVIAGTGRQSESVKRGVWTNNADFCYYEKNLCELNGKTLGIIGLGNIGKRVAAIAMAFGMKVACYDVNAEDYFDGVENLSLNELFARSDIISLNCPLTKENEEIICEANIKKMKDGVVIINTARGALVKEKDLAAALNSGKVGGAGVDVLSCEPPHYDNPLLSAKNIVITPHQAWAAREARARLMGIAVDNVLSYLKGEPKNVVNKK